jgi:hypothetical protein
LILLECCAINICAANTSWQVISLHLKEHAWTEWQFHLPQIQLHIQPHNLMSLHYISLPWTPCLLLSLLKMNFMSYLPPEPTQDSGNLHCNTHLFLSLQRVLPLPFKCLQSNHHQTIANTLQWKKPLFP